MEKLGIEPSLLLAQIINFAIIVVVLSKLLYKPILSMLEKRKREIEESLRLTDKLRADEEKLLEKKNKVIDEARREAVQIIEEARKQGKEEEAAIVKAARNEAEQILVKGKNELNTVREKMEKDVRKSAIELATLMSKRLLSSVMTSDDKHKILAKHLKELEGLEA
ncbi:MAG: ATP synthase subunit b [Candidatus Gottesmanbacteria bacterium GW2011_GWA2_47_9]|uniref:ATP synthase subunit b n=1 Tax=Candidatus Gottesmanbacteria bacterium GW2011_GWA2_47_9 TaxID=1618445 RepID=A0A0G1WYZ1_9BACT|nr:MAG: ATP synthase subunit b [Candidatus Gottesmanbacteria bacterium GW2011_GWA2_47_9]